MHALPHALPQPTFSRSRPSPPVVLGKTAHYGLVLGLPWYLHGGDTTLAAAATYAATQVP